MRTGNVLIFGLNRGLIESLPAMGASERLLAKLGIRRWLGVGLASDVVRPSTPSGNVIERVRRETGCLSDAALFATDGVADRQCGSGVQIRVSVALWRDTQERMLPAHNWKDLVLPSAGERIAQ